MKNKILAAILTVTLAGVMTACGNNGGGGNADASVTQSSKSTSDSGTKSEDTMLGADSATLRLKVGTTTAPEGHYVKGLQEMQKLLEEYSDGEMTLDIYPNSQLGNERDMMENVGMGVQEMCLISTGPIPNFVSDFAVLDLPYLFEDEQHAYEVLDGEIGTSLLGQLESQGIRGVGFWENGFREVTNDKKEIKTPEDLKGMKIRTMENSLHMELFNSLGAMATPMASGDVFTGLQQKTIDAAENAVSDVLANKFYEVTKNITYTNHLFVFMGVGFSERAWNKIPDELKPVVDEAVKRGCNTQRQLLAEANAEAEKELKELGVQFYEIDREALKAKVLPAIEPYRAQMPKEWLDAIEADKNNQ